MTDSMAPGLTVFFYAFFHKLKFADQKSKDMSFLDDLMPWSEKLPEGIRKN